MRQLYLSIVMSCLFLGPVWAGETLSLAEALKIAYQHHPHMIIARHGIDVAQGERMSAGSWDNLQIEIEPDTFTVKQPIDPFGKRLKGKVARQNVLVKEQNLKSVWGEVYAQVRDSYAKIMLGQKELELQKINLKAMRQVFSHVQMRYHSGKIKKNQLQRTKVALLNVESAYWTVVNDISIEKARLNINLGRAKETPFEIEEHLKEEDFQEDLKALTQKALSNSPVIQKERLTLEAKKQNVHQEELNRLPDLSIGVQKINADEKDDFGAVFEISVPLWGLNQGEIKKAKAERSLQETLVEDMIEEVDFEVYFRFQEIRLGLKQVDRRKKALKEANEMFALSSIRFQEGDLAFAEYLDNVQASIDTRIDYYRSLYTLNNSISALEKTVYASLRGEGFLQ